MEGSRYIKCEYEVYLAIVLWIQNKMAEVCKSLFIVLELAGSPSLILLTSAPLQMTPPFVRAFLALVMTFCQRT